MLALVDAGGTTIVVNGSELALPAGTTVAELVSTWCTSPVGIAVARNREVVPRSAWSTTDLADRDVVEIVSAAAGG
jgi:sulfur carrier protein